MASHTRRLPLFPLNTVLFPGASLPLQIFEERYKLMLRECMESDNKFGVSLIREGTEVGGPALPHVVGTVAHLVQVSRIEGDRFFVAAIGQRRFRVSEITQWTPFVAAEVELLDEGADETVPDTLIEETTSAFSEYARVSMGMAGGWVRQPRIPKSPLALSYHIACNLQVDLPGKQSLLEQESVASRLQAELDLLSRESAKLRRRMVWEMIGRFSRQ